MVTGTLAATLQRATLSSRGHPGYDVDYRDQLCRRTSAPHPGVAGGWTDDDGGVNADVYVVSTGVDTGHPQLTGNVSHLAGWSHAEGAADTVGTGTAAAGLIVSNQFGMARAAHVISAKLLAADGTWTDADVAAIVTAILASAAARAPRVAVVLWLHADAPTVQYAAVVPPSDDQDSIQRELKRLLAAGIPVVAPAGDGLRDNGVAIGFLNAAVVRPARMPDVLTVGAVDRHDQPYWFTGYGHAVDVFAPGYPVHVCGVGQYAAVHAGTAVAAALVAALAAVIRSAQPAWSPAAVKQFIRANGVGKNISIAYAVAQRDPLLSPTPPVQLTFQYSHGRPTGVAYPYDVEFEDTLVKWPWLRGRFVVADPAVSAVAGTYVSAPISGLAFVSAYGDTLPYAAVVTGGDAGLAALADAAVLYGPAPATPGNYTATIAAQHGRVSQPVTVAVTVSAPSGSGSVAVETYRRGDAVPHVALTALRRRDRVRLALPQRPPRTAVLTDVVSGSAVLLERATGALRDRQAVAADGVVTFTGVAPAAYTVVADVAGEYGAVDKLTVR